jgi:phosphoglycolate phosphatase-like HAD superfamily hydrolase
MWDVDGVLASLDHAYFRLLTEHPDWRGKYGGLKFEDLAKALPISPKFGTLELSVHPLFGKKLNDDFCYRSGGIYFDRPLYPNVRETLAELDDLGYFQLTMSSGFDAKVKRKMIADTLGPDLSFVHIEVVEHAKPSPGPDEPSAGHAKSADGQDAGAAMVGEKEARILECLAKYNLKADETVLVDDRIFNCETALKIGMRAVRARWAVSTPSPPGLGLVEVSSILKFKEWLFARSGTTASPQSCAKLGRRAAGLASTPSKEPANASEKGKE